MYFPDVLVHLELMFKPGIAEAALELWGLSAFVSLVAAQREPLAVVPPA